MPFAFRMELLVHSTPGIYFCTNFRRVQSIIWRLRPVCNELASKSEKSARTASLKLSAFRASCANIFRRDGTRSKRRLPRKARDIKHTKGRTESTDAGLTDLDEILKERIASLKLDRDRAKTALDRIRHRSPANNIDPEVIERFGRIMRENITTGGIPFRKAYIQAVVDRVEVDDHAIRIIGDKATLEQVVAGRASTAAGVRSFVRNWRAGRDSNPPALTRSKFSLASAS